MVCYVGRQTDRKIDERKDGYQRLFSPEVKTVGAHSPPCRAEFKNLWCLSFVSAWHSTNRTLLKQIFTVDSPCQCTACVYGRGDRAPSVLRWLVTEAASRSRGWQLDDVVLRKCWQHCCLPSPHPSIWNIKVKRICMSV